MKLLNDKVVLITGAGSNVGRATAKLFAQSGARLMLADIDPDRIVDPPSGSEIIAVDLTSPDDCQVMADAVSDRFGRLDGLCNTAGIDPPTAGTTTGTSVEDWDMILDVNLKGTFLSCRAAIPLMIDSGGATIANIASQGALLTLPAMTAYGVSKAGVLQLTRQIASDHAKDGLRANCVCPSGLEQPSVDRLKILSDERLEMRAQMMAKAAPLGRVCGPEDVANALLFLSSDLCGFTTGCAFPVEGGATSMIKF
jgi:NAD(P)-dependent dehydrogenase (short-subunit alcohol dehydrogenase family)